jgi:hypothetical protein
VPAIWRAYAKTLMSQAYMTLTLSS